LVNLPHEFTRAIEHPASGFHPRLLLGPSRESDPGPAHGLVQILAGSPEFFQFVIADPRKQQTGAEIHLPSACVVIARQFRLNQQEILERDDRLSPEIQECLATGLPSRLAFPRKRRPGCHRLPDDASNDCEATPGQEDDEEALVAGSHGRVSIAISQVGRNGPTGDDEPIHTERSHEEGAPNHRETDPPLNPTPTSREKNSPK
jgi:hypothetical protein